MLFRIGDVLEPAVAYTVHPSHGRAARDQDSFRGPCHGCHPACFPDPVVHTSSRDTNAPRPHSLTASNSGVHGSGGCSRNPVRLLVKKPSKIVHLGDAPSVRRLYGARYQRKQGTVRCASRNDKRSKGLVGADRSPRRYGEAADGARTGLGEGIPEIPKLRSRVLKVFGAIEVAHHQFLPGEIETLPFKGPVVNLHLSAPHRLVQRQHDLTRKGLVATNNAAVTPAGVHGYWRTQAASEDMSMLLEGGFIRWVARESDVDPDRIEIAPLFSAPDPQIERIGLSLLSEMETRGLGGELYAESLATVLALHLLREHSSLGRGSRQKVGREGGFSKRALRQATDYINDNLPRKLTLAEIAGSGAHEPRRLRPHFQDGHRAHAAPVRHPPARRACENPDLGHRPDRRGGRPSRGFLQPEPPRPPRQASAWRLPRCPAPGHYTLAHSISRKERDSVLKERDSVRQSILHPLIMPVNGLRNEGSVRILAGPKNTGEAGKREDRHPAYTDTRTSTPTPTINRAPPIVRLAPGATLYT